MYFCPFTACGSSQSTPSMCFSFPSNCAIHTTIHTLLTLCSFQTGETHVEKVRMIVVAKATRFSRGRPSQQPTLWGYSGSSSIPICPPMCSTSKAPTQDFFAATARIAELLAPAVQ
eukprot:COSAG02_NODE_181_length_30783_cov_53.060520_17_plen_116_part_00